jgi:hypothetical protein
MGVLPLPLIAMGGGALCLLLAIATLIRQRRIVEIVPNKGQVVVPSFWDERAITNQLHLYSKEPALLSHYVFAIKERFIIGQNRQTIERRTEFLKSVFEQADIIKNLKGLGHDMEKMDAQHEIEMLEFELRRLDLTAQQSRHGTATSLKQEDDELDIQLRIAEKKQRLDQIGKPAPAPQQQSKDEIRAQRKAELEREIQRLKTDKVLAVGHASSDEERKYLDNMYEDRIAEVRNDLRRYL